MGGSDKYLLKKLQIRLRRQLAAARSGVEQASASIATLDAHEISLSDFVADLGVIRGDLRMMQELVNNFVLELPTEQRIQ